MRYKKLKAYLPNHEVYTVSEKGWNGLFNGRLMAKCIDNDIDILLTVDKNILYQQSIAKYDLTIVVFDAFNSKISTLVQFLPILESRIQTFEKRNLYVIEL